MRPVSGRRTSAIAALAALLGACQQGDGATVSWQERWRPGVQIVGDTVKRRRGELPPAHSAIFDGHTVRLRAARGEVLGVQVLLHRTGYRQVSLSFPVPGVTVESFDVGFLDVTEPSSPGEYGHSVGPGAYPDILRSGSGPIAADDQVFFDVAVAVSAQPGLHRGELVAGSDRFPVELTVEPIEIRIDREPWVWVWFKSTELMREHGLPDEDGPQQLAIERAYSDLFRRHGCLLATDYFPDRLRRRLHLLTPDVHFWPVALSKDDPAAMERQAAEWLDFFRGRPTLPFTFTIDEPSGAERDQVRTHAEAVHRAGGGPPTLPFMVTDAAAPIYRGAVDIFCSPLSIPPPPGWPAATRFWTYNGRPPRAGNMTIDKPGTALRTWGWIGARYDIGLWYAWEGMYYSDRYNLGPGAPADRCVAQPAQRRRAPQGRPRLGQRRRPAHVPRPGPVAPPQGAPPRPAGPPPPPPTRILRPRSSGPSQPRSPRRMVPAALGAVAADQPQTWPDDEMSWETARNHILDAILARCPRQGH